MVPFAKASASIPKISKNINLKYNIEKKKLISVITGRVSDCCLMPNEQFYSYIMARTSYIQWNDDDYAYFVLAQHT
jgi:hypothetical protein